MDNSGRFSFLLWLTILLSFFNSAGQNNINFTSITVREGLSSNTVNSILKDRYGLVWFATTNGLNKFDGSNFTVYRHQPGNPNSLPTNEVLCLYEDHNGNIWIGMGGGGVCVYDRKFDRFIQYKGDASWPAIKTISVRAVTQDHFGRIWIATYNDLRMFEPKSRRITVLPIKKFDAKYTPSLVVLSLFEDSRHRMWVGTNQGLYLYDWDSGRFQSFTHNPSNAESISNDIIKTITEDSNRNIWFGTYGGLNEWVSFNHFHSFRHLQKHPSISNDAIFAVAPDTDGKLWVGTENGLNIFDPNNNTSKYIMPDSRNIFSLKGWSIRSILIDRKGIYWVGTVGEGIGKYDKMLPLFNLIQSNPFDPMGLKSPVVNSFAENEQGQIFVGTDVGGLERFNKTTRLFSPIDIKSKLNERKQNLTILGLYYDSKKQLWAGTYHDGLFRINPHTGSYVQFVADGTTKQINNNDVTSIKEDRNGDIWIGTLGGGLNIYNPTSHEFRTFTGNEQNKGSGTALPLNKYISTLACAPNGDMWIGSIGTGIAVYNSSKKSFLHYLKNKGKLADDVVQNIFFAGDGSAWVGTNQGLSHFNKKNQTFSSYDEKSGLANGFVKAILEDNNGLIWLSTDKGISSFDRHKKIFKNYTSENGVQQSSFITGAALKTADGDLFFGGQYGFNFFNPKTLPEAPSPGPILFTELKVDNIPVQPGKDLPIQEQIGIAQEIKLKFSRNFSISYVAIDYTSPKQNRYEYRLTGFDKNWNFVRDTRIANYTNLDPGEYVFQVRVSNNDLIWNTPAKEIKIIVLPPFWRTDIAYLTYAIITIGILFFMRRRAISNIRRKFESEQEKLQVKQMIEQERREAEQLHNLDVLKIKFLTDLSHEFRTPISLIAAPVERLLGKNLDKDIGEHLILINRNARRLLNLVNQLLDFRKMEENELRLVVSPGDIIAFIVETAESFKEIAVGKQICLDIKHTVNNWPAIFDHDKIERIIFNLLSNAFKFTPNTGMVTLDIDIFEDESLQAILVLTVTDNGIGIEKQHLEKIFERFYQPERLDSILNQGTGIGLAIAKEYVELQKGKIWAESKMGSGSKFFVEIPLIADQQTQKARGKFQSLEPTDIKPSANAIKKEINGISEGKATILLVEDNDEFRCYLADYLKQFHHIVEAVDGKEGWQKVLSTHPQLVVSDVSMPAMDGIELSKKIKGDKRTRQVPVILLTARTGEEEQLKGLKTGASDFLSKPFSFQILNTKIENLLALKKSLKETYSKQVYLIEPQIEAEPANVRLIESVRKYINEKLTHADISVDDLARHMGMSRGTLYSKIIELTGLPPIEYMRSVKLEKAAALLDNGNYNVTQVAYMTGFTTPSYFSKVFKEKFSITPSEYLHLKKQQIKT